METILKDTHLSSETLEDYVRGRLTESEVTVINDHLFECDACHERYDQEVQFRTIYRKAASEAPAPSSRTIVPFLSRFTGTPGQVLAAALAVVLAIFFVPRLTNYSSSPAVAELTAFRNAGSRSAPANRQLLLRLDTSGLDDIRQVRAEVADSTGATMWSGNAAIQSSRLEVTVDRRLSPGQYWVRLYAGTQSEVVREFSLQLK